MSAGTSCHLLQVSNKSLLKSDFVQFFNALIHVYSPRAGDKVLMSTETSCVTLFICCKFQKNVFEV